MGVEDATPGEEWGDQPDYRERTTGKPVAPMTPLVPTTRAPAPAASRLAESVAEDLVRSRTRTPEGRRQLLQIQIANGRTVLTCSLVAHCAGTFEPTYPECPHCHEVLRREVIHPFLSALVLIYTGEKRDVYALVLSCDACIAKANENSEAAKKQRKQDRLVASGFSKAFLGWTLDTYPNQRSDWLKRARDYVSAGAQHDVLLWGNPGVGKTGLGVGIMRSLADAGKKVRLIRATEIMLMLRDSMRPKAMADEGMSEMEIIRHLSDVEYLMIDDLSSIAGTEYQDEITGLMLDLRQKSGRPTILTFNLKIPRGPNGDPSRALKEFLGEIVFDRVREYGESWHMTGSSVRPGR